MHNLIVSIHSLLQLLINHFFLFAFWIESRTPSKNPTKQNLLNKQISKNLKPLIILKIFNETLCIKSKNKTPSIGFLHKIF